MRSEFKERYELANRLYAEIFPILAGYESRGFNAHQRTQNIVAEAIEKCEKFVIQNAVDLSTGDERSQI